MKNWQKEFIWNSKKTRFRFIILKTEKERGGLAVPNIKLYYQADGLVWILDKIKNPNGRLLKLESSDLEDGLHGYIWTKKSI